MKKYLSLVAVVILFGTAGVFAQVTASDSITVTATNQGIFSFNIADASYAFGTVNANGAANVGGTDALTGTPFAGGATYTASAASTWSAQSAPARTVRIFNASTTSVIGWGTADRLAMGIPSSNQGGTSCGLVAFGTTGDGLSACANGNLIHGVAVGNGANDADGDLDFQLTVDDTDAAGSNTWTVVLTAAGA
ncbi:MAG TPA: hypothetical protein VMS12_02865 [Thermoanaerobaculia bacterium]|nr:hypothetical protein [Thermoanaerobaculia bacterium]